MTWDEFEKLCDSFVRHAANGARVEAVHKNYRVYEHKGTFGISVDLKDKDTSVIENNHDNQAHR